MNGQNMDKWNNRQCPILHLAWFTEPLPDNNNRWSGIHVWQHDSTGQDLSAWWNTNGLGIGSGNKESVTEAGVQRWNSSLRIVLHHEQHGTPYRRKWKFLDPTPQKIRGHVPPPKKCQGAQLQHTYKPYTGGQLTGYIPVNMRCRTSQARTHARSRWQCPILRLARFAEPLPDNDNSLILPWKFANIL